MTELIGRTSAGRVHVVRHAFEPNEPLTELIETFARPHVRPRFLLRSTKEVYVDSVTYARGGYREEDDKAKAAVEHAKRHPFIIGRVAMRLLYPPTVSSDGERGAPRAYRMAFLPTDSDAFGALASSLDVYPSVAPHVDPPRHYLFLDLPASAAYMPGQELAEETLQETVVRSVQKGLFSATITGLRSIEAPLRHAVIRESTSVSDESE